MGHARSYSATPLLPYAEAEEVHVRLQPLMFLGKHPAHALSPRRMRPILRLLVVAAIITFGLYAGTTMNKSLLVSTVDGDTVFPQFTNKQSLLPENNTSAVSQTEEAQEMYPPWVLGPPTQSFRDNLRMDRKYISSWLAAGWNNDVMTVFNLIYLAQVTERIPIIPMFTPSWHIGGGAAGGLPFSEVFDIPRFIEETGTPILEWHEVKDPKSEVVDEIGCWNIWESVQYYEAIPRGSDVPEWLNLDVSYTQAPDWVKMMPGNEHNKGAGFWDLARLAFPEDRSPSLGRNVRPSPLHNVVILPDEHMLCYDYLYFVGGSQDMEYDYEYGPAWRFVGRQMHFTPQLETLAAQYVNRAIGLPVNDPVPNYIAVHARHGDFSSWCWEAENIEDCFAPLSVIARRVNEVQTEIQERYGEFIPMERVIMTSDETDEEWWQNVAAYGWKRIDHVAEQTAELYTRWHSLIIDSVIQANSLGFVGTYRSTFSVLSRRRVFDWNYGSARMVFWGKKGADDH